MYDHPLGQSAAVAASAMWALCSILFAASGRRIGALSVNAYRIILGGAMLSISHFLLIGTIEDAATQMQWFFLILSGIIGLGIGDFAYFGSLVYIGPRKGVLIMSINPIFAVGGAYLLLSEVPTAYALVGIGVILMGLFIVIYEKEGLSDEPFIRSKGPRAKYIGIAMGLTAALGQGLGLVLTKYAMEDLAPSDQSMDPLTATLIRMIGACVFIWIVVLATKRLKPVVHSGKDRRGMGLMAGGAIFGPFLGVWASTVAIANTYTGIASILMSLTPVLIIPALWVIYKQRTNMRGIVGAFIVVIGVAIIFLL